MLACKLSSMRFLNYHAINKKRLPRCCPVSYRILHFNNKKTGSTKLLWCLYVTSHIFVVCKLSYSPTYISNKQTKSASYTQDNDRSSNSTLRDNSFLKNYSSTNPMHRSFQYNLVHMGKNTLQKHIRFSLTQIDNKT